MEEEKEREEKRECMSEKEGGNVERMYEALVILQTRSNKKTPQKLIENDHKKRTKEKRELAGRRGSVYCGLEQLEGFLSALHDSAHHGLQSTHFNGPVPGLRKKPLKIFKITEKVLCNRLRIFVKHESGFVNLFPSYLIGLSTPVRRHRAGVRASSRSAVLQSG